MIVSIRKSFDLFINIGFYIIRIIIYIIFHFVKELTIMLKSWSFRINNSLYLFYFFNICHTDAPFLSI